MGELSRKRRSLERDRQVQMQKVMEEYDDRVYWPALEKLYEECEADTGHVYVFDQVGFFPWIEFWKCQNCGKGKTLNLKEDT